jgi:hypothetical protein
MLNIKYKVNESFQIIQCLTDKKKCGQEEF